jgi:hypothetical protein
MCSFRSSFPSFLLICFLSYILYSFHVYAYSGCARFQVLTAVPRWQSFAMLRLIAWW